ncbi:hypothetical protein G4V62_18130 [Bacillaceae bacterium SIJ1]|uniref:hypothetical protein n=1 Tax=Litoribacterium kuwaitense TaxID=1398745 RepID=UPI0013EDB8FF|nr:hypothetical protein [Litoribacterium kuwaitense]NGP46766.1 hypothetical protein [Litoribacterium kuwaitense]
MRVYQQAFDYLGMEISQHDLLLYRYFLTARAFTESKNILETAKLLKLLKFTIEKHDYDMETFNTMISSHFRANCLNEKFDFYQTIKIYKEYFQDIFRFS